MKKYFVKGIDEPLEYGDTIGLDLVKESDDKTKSITRHVEVPFTPDTKDMFVELEAIEEKEVEDEKQEVEDEEQPSVKDVVEGLDSDGCPVDDEINEINNSIEDIADILNKHQAIIKHLEKRVIALESKKEPIDIFNSNYFQPLGTMFRLCL